MPPLGEDVVDVNQLPMSTPPSPPPPFLTDADVPPSRDERRSGGINGDADHGAKPHPNGKVSDDNRGNR